MEAQQTNAIAGEYYLSGVREAASGFKLNEDHTFQFFLSYGALDREGRGTWQVKNNKVILTSAKPTGQGFALVTHKAVDNEKITIRIPEENPIFESSVSAVITSGGKKQEAMSENGLISFAKQPVDSIVLKFEFCPEKTAVFAFTNPADNYFEFRFEPTMMEIYFDELPLTLGERKLSGQLPFLAEAVYEFEKN